jgi:hypothetical protein
MILETYARVYLDAGAMNEACDFYKELLAGEETLRFTNRAVGLEIAAISSTHLSVILIAGPAENRRPFEPTRLTIRVEKLETAVPMLKHLGAQQLEPIQSTPIGRKTRFRHPDGLTVEYIDRNNAG